MKISENISEILVLLGGVAFVLGIVLTSINMIFFISVLAIAGGMFMTLVGMICILAAIIIYRKSNGVPAWS
jgi:tryptophan-rich sensory protein